MSLRVGNFLPMLCLTTAFFISRLPAFSQYEELINKPYLERAAYLWKIGDSVHNQPDSSLAFAVTDKLIETAGKNKDIALQLEGELYAAFYLTKYFPEQEERIVSSLKNIIRRAAASNSREAEWKARQVLAGYYFYHLHFFETAFEEYNDLYRLIQPVSFKEFPDKIHILYYIGTAYFFFRDYPKAIQYFRENPDLYPVTHFWYTTVHSVNNIAACYQKLGQLDSSDYYSHLIYDYALKEKDSTWIGIIKGNLGHNEYLRGRFDQAIPLLGACVEQAIADKDWNLASGSLMILADIYFKQNNIAAASAATLQAAEFVKRPAEYKYDHYEQLYSLLAKMHAYKGNPDLSLRYIDSSHFVKDSLNRQFSGLMLARALQKDAIAQQKAKLADIESKRKLSNLKFYAALVIAGLILIISFFIYRNKRLRHKQEQVLKDMQLREKEKELQSAREQLLSFTHHLAEKNELIEQFEMQNGSKQAIKELEQTVILTGKDWGRFRELFEQVHPGYLHRLTQKIPGITPAEIRLMALARLNFSNKEMAAALGVTPQSIRVTWHRLRKKANLSEEGSSEELVNQI
jgi:DNA-binding CsgD family transcriptional regulator/tetratricopeptide (TPR) repeat protein